MKKLVLLSGILGVCTFLSCSKFLEENPRDQISEEDAYDNATSAYLNTVATLYNYVGGFSDSQGLQGTYRGIYDLNTFTTDEAILPTRGGDWYDGGFWQGLFLHKWGVNSDAIQATWEYLYKVIVLSNKSLERLDEFYKQTNNKYIPAYMAEVRAFRAMYYYYLVDLFGRVPLVLSSSTPMKEVKQSTRAEVFEFVVKELQESLPLLSTERSNRLGDYYGRMTRPVAYFLLAKLALNAEVYTNNNWTSGSRPDGKNLFFEVGGQRLNAWQTVMAYCDSITIQGYQLSPDYENNFSVFNETSVENIFTIPMDKNFYTNQMQYLFRSRHYNHAKAYGLSGENGSSATIEALRTFGYDTDSVDARFDKCYFAGIMLDLNGDTIRLDNGEVLVYLPWEVDLDVSGRASEKVAGARMKKYAIDKTGTKDGKLSDNDIVLFRYADVLLMKSEAKVRNGENGDAELNQVRSRVGMPDRRATLDNVLAERQLEFAWEGWRRQDLVRFGLFTRSYSSRPQLPDEGNGYTTVFPIPENILLLNGNLTQNPGY
ncbi:RagB/SusD family nutrient uptake outer membrane protein [Parabacteroides goldsteinii]|uniref:RagB/SusD family nutrient uptake outer membrane protein n=1 Tax=uncultured Parabacteroides sp. TaxID=512312 RepID=UPI00101D7E00|nr:RagB/SusD family nutrient uptake outer membrane protein [Parabacteroides goldsteinii]